MDGTAPSAATAPALFRNARRFMGTLPTPRGALRLHLRPARCQTRRGAPWGGRAMGFVGIEEIFLKVHDLEKAIDFYHRKLGIPLAKQDTERAYLQCERGHLVLQIE